MRTLPSALVTEKSSIAKYLNELIPQLSNDDQWAKTLALINELNLIASENKPLHN